MRGFLARFANSRLAALALAVAALILGSALLASWIMPYDPAMQDIMERLKPPMSVTEDGRHWLGTDALGRDLLSRLIAGSRVSLLVGAASVVISGAIGIACGLVAGYDEKVSGRVLMAVTDVQLAIPFLVLALAVVAV